MFYADRVQETTTTTGTSTLVLAGAVASYQAFSAAFTNGDTVRYAIVFGTDWEVGTGVYSAGTLARVTVYGSSNAGAKVVFAAGTKNVWCDLPASALSALGGGASKAALYRDASGHVACSTVFSIDDPGSTVAIVADNNSVPLTITNYAPSTNGVNMMLRKARGTLALPTKALSGDSLGGFSGRGYYEDAGAGFGPATASSFKFLAEEDFTSTTGGTSYVVNLTKKGGTTTSEVFKITSNGYLTLSGKTASSGSTGLVRYTAAAHTAQTASTEVIDWWIDGNATLQFATGAITTQRQNLIQARTYSAVGASVITTAATLVIDKAPVAGTNVTITNAYALWVQDGTSRFDDGIIIGTTTAFVWSRNAAGTGLVPMLMSDASDRVSLGDTAADYFRVTPGGGDGRLVVSGECVYDVGSGQNHSLRSGAVTCLAVGNLGNTATDQRNAITTDLAVVSQYLSAAKSTTLTTGVATNFTFLVNASEVWEIEVTGNVICGTGGAQFGLDCPASATLEGQFTWATTSSTAFATVAMVAINTAYGAASVSSGSPGRPFTLKALVTVAATGGSIALRLYSVTAGQTSTLGAKAHFKARRAVAV